MTNWDNKIENENFSEFILHMDIFNVFIKACDIHVCSSDTVVTEITCETAVTDTTQCATGYSLATTTTTN